MAEREYVFVLKNDTTESSRSPVAGDTTESAAKKSIKTDETQRAKDIGKVFAAVAAVESFVVPVVNHEVNKVEILTGAKEYAQKINFEMQIGQRAFDIGKTVLAGALVGGGVGALAGVVLGLAKQGVDLVMRVDTYNAKRDVENETISRNLRRTGTNQSRSTKL